MSGAAKQCCSTCTLLGKVIARSVLQGVRLIASAKWTQASATQNLFISAAMARSCQVSCKCAQLSHSFKIHLDRGPVWSSFPRVAP